MPTTTVQLPLPPLPPTVCAAMASLQELDSSRLHVDERSILGSFKAEKRRTDFTLGRIAARKALRVLGSGAGPSIPEVPIVRDDHGAPVWPLGTVGSLCHAGDAALAIVARTSDVWALGIDMEPRAVSLRFDISTHIAGEREREWIKAVPSETHLRSLLAFTAKESIYKAFAPHHKEFFGFDAVELSWTDDRAGCAATLTKRLHERLPKGFSFPVSFAISPEWIVAATCVL